MSSEIDMHHYRALATQIRAHCLRMTYWSKSGHLGGSLSTVDLLAVLYEKILRVDSKNPHWPERDRFILSKGHAACGVYAVLAEKGFFPKEWLKTYYQDGGHLSGHISHHVPGVEASTGSLGHGLSIGCGIAYGAKFDKKRYRVFVLLSERKVAFVKANVYGVKEAKEIFGIANEKYGCGLCLKEYFVLSHALKKG